jgi:hypothetical protein
MVYEVRNRCKRINAYSATVARILVSDKAQTGEPATACASFAQDHLRTMTCVTTQAVSWSAC